MILVVKTIQRIFLRNLISVLLSLFIVPGVSFSKIKPITKKDELNLDEATLEIMLQSLPGKDSPTKQKIIRRISILDDKNGISPMIFYFLNPNEEVDTRREAAKAVISLGGEINNAPLIKILDGAPLECYKIIKGLLEISDRRFVDSLVKYTTLPEIENSCRNNGTLAYLKIMGTEDKNFNFSQLLGTKGELSLIEVLKNPGSYYKSNAIFISGEIKSKKALPELIQKLSDKDTGVKTASIRAIAKIKGKESYKSLGELLKKDLSLSIKDECIRALVSMGGNQGAKEIEKSYKSAGLESKSNILKSLDLINKSSSKALIKRLLDSEKDPAVKKQLKEKMKEEKWY